MDAIQDTNPGSELSELVVQSFALPQLDQPTQPTQAAQRDNGTHLVTGVIWPFVPQLPLSQFVSGINLLN